MSIKEMHRGICFHHDDETGRYWKEGEEGEFTRKSCGGLVVETVDRNHIHTGNEVLRDFIGKPVEKGGRLKRPLMRIGFIDHFFKRREELVSLGIDENGVFGHFHDGVYPRFNIKNLK